MFARLAPTVSVEQDREQIHRESEPVTTQEKRVHQFYGSDALGCQSLMMPQAGFLPAS
jgi:hypothetical protein